MINREKRHRNNYLLSQALAYLAAGVFLILSYDLYHNSVINYIGYSLLSLSVVILISMLVSELVPDIREQAGPTQKEILWFLKHLKRRVASTLDEIASGALPIVTIASLVTDLLGRIIASHNSSADGIANTLTLNLTNVLIIVMSVFILYILVQFASLVKTNLKLGIFAFIIILILIFTNLFFRSIFNQVFISIVAIVFISLVMVRVRKEREVKIGNRGKYILPLYRIFILLSFVFIIAGILSSWAGSIEMEKYFGVSIFLLYCASALSLLVLPWKNHLPLVVKTRFILLFLLGGALFITMTFFSINRYVIIGGSLVGIVSYFLPGMLVLRKSSRLRNKTITSPVSSLTNYQISSETEKDKIGKKGT